MENTYTNLRNSYKLGNQYVQDCFKLIESQSGYELMFKNMVDPSGQNKTQPPLVHEDFFKQLDPTNKAFRKYQNLYYNFKPDLETIAFTRGMRKDKEKFIRIGC